MDDESTAPNTPLAKLLETTLDKVLDRREEAQAAKVAAMVINAIGQRLYTLEATDRIHAGELDELRARTVELERSVANIRSQLARMPTIPPPAAE